ncbi:MAG: hypothetical protein WD431_22255, partial [Cyclobacteriaceae bacterium]
MITYRDPTSGETLEFLTNMMGHTALTISLLYKNRWTIELNFRDEKSTNGCGEAQMRNGIAAVKVPQFVVAMHAFVHLADNILNNLNTATALPKAKWEQKNTRLRPSTNNILKNFRGCYVCFLTLMKNQNKLLVIKYI